MSAANPGGDLSKPLAGIRVVDLSNVFSGPMCTAMLADQGADVIKVEAPGGDLSRKLGPVKGGLSAMYIAANRGKRSIVLDTTKPDARPVLRELIAKADVLVENFRPGAMARMGLDQTTLDELNPRLVVLSITGFGPDGPYADGRVYDAVIQAVSGVCASHPDWRTKEPLLLQTTVCDKLTALTAAQAVTAALLGRARDGKGRRVEVSMLDASLMFQWPDAMYNHVFVDEPPPPYPEFGSTTRLWRTRDGHVAIMAPQPDEFAAMCEGFGMPDMPKDPRFATPPERAKNGREIRRLLEPLAAQQSTDECVARMRAAGTPIGRVNERHEVVTDPQVVHNGSIAEFEHDPAIGRVRLPRAAARVAGAPPHQPGRAARLGEHGREVLAELGLEAERIDALLASGALRLPAA